MCAVNVIWRCLRCTPSARRATSPIRQRFPDRLISIHALREEGDLQSRKRQLCGKDFNPRPPRGGRPKTNRNAITAQVFQSTPSARRATSSFSANINARLLYFNPRPPRGGRRGCFFAEKIKECISIHALREEGDSNGGR